MSGARLVIETHQRVVNERDVKAYIETVAFPFTYQNFDGISITVETPDQYGTLYPAPWETVLSAFPDWLRTENEAVEEVVASQDSAVFMVTARWITSNKIPHKPITAI